MSGMVGNAVQYQLKGGDRPAHRRAHHKQPSTRQTGIRRLGVQLVERDFQNQAPQGIFFLVATRPTDV